MKPTNFLEFYGTVSAPGPIYRHSFSPQLRKGTVNLERFHYLRRHFSVGFSLMNINTARLSGGLFSFIFSYILPRNRAASKADLRLYTAATVWILFEVGFDIQRTERRNNLFLCVRSISWTYLGEVDLQRAATGVYVCSVKRLLCSCCRFHRVERGYRKIRLRIYR